MPRKNTRKNKMRGGWPDIDMSSYMPNTSGLTSYMPDTSSWFGAKKEEPTTVVTEFPTEGGKNKRKRRRMRGGAYTSNSSAYGANAGSYSGASTARAQSWVGGRKSRKKRRKNY